jgi:hypothetical protein
VIKLPDIPGDANFTRITAAFLPVQGKSAPAQLSQTSKIKKNGGSEETFDVSIAVPVTPTNITLRLEGGEVFWTFNNTLSEAYYDLPDLAEQVNLYLDRLTAQGGKPQGALELAFLIEAGSAGEAKIGLYEIAYSRLKTASWLNPLDQTTRVDRNIELDFGDIHRLELERIQEMPGSPVVLREVRLDVGGEVGPERLLGQVVAHDQRAFAAISSDYSLAQEFTLPVKANCAGISGLFTPDGEAEVEVYVEIQPDLNGAPAAGQPLAQGKLVLTPDPEGAANNWSLARFNAPVALEAGKPYWCLVRGVQGRAWLALQEQEGSYLTATRFNRGGQFWKSAGAAAQAALPLLRVVYLPDIDNQAAAVVLRLQGTNVSQATDPAPAAQGYALAAPPGLEGAVTLEIESHAQGSLSIANIIQEYVLK